MTVQEIEKINFGCLLGFHCYHMLGKERLQEIKTYGHNKFNMKYNIKYRTHVCCKCGNIKKPLVEDAEQ